MRNKIESTWFAFIVLKIMPQSVNYYY